MLATTLTTDRGMFDSAVEHAKSSHPGTNASVTERETWFAETDELFISTARAYVSSRAYFIHRFKSIFRR